MEKQIKLPVDIGSAKKGEIYVRGLHDTPEFYRDKNVREDFYWEKGYEESDNRFLTANCIKGCQKELTQKE